MAKKKEVVEEVVEEVVVQNEDNTVQHLDRDPNDPRNQKPGEPGVSLNEVE